MAWHAKTSGGYGYTSAEALDNAKMFVDILTPLGWSLNSICAVLGNVYDESGYNPWRWENDIIMPSTGAPWLASGGYNHGYGLFQYTPAGNYINDAKSLRGYGPNFSDQTGKATDGTAQLLFMNQNFVHDYKTGNEGVQYYYTDSSTYKISWAAFKAGTGYSLTELTYAWCYNFERGVWHDVRLTAAQYMANALAGYSPSTSTIPVWLLFKLKEANNKR